MKNKKCENYLSPCPKLDSEYDYVKWHLLTYGNTNVVKKPTKIIKMLKSEGIEVSVRHYVGGELDILANKNIKSQDWILTLIK